MAKKLTVLSRFRLASSRNGFTLTELAIVLGVMGVMLGAIWAAAATVNARSKVSTASAQMLSIVNGYHALYGSRGVDATDATDVTCFGVSGGAFPANMLPSAACVTGTTTTYPQNPWGGIVQVFAYQSTQSVAIALTNLTQNACINLANATFNAPGVIADNVNTNNPNQYSPPVSETSINTLCANPTNWTYTVFKAN